MSHTLTIDGVSFLPVAEAASHFGYTKYYILLLVKEGKIDGRKIERRWYVDMRSGDAYFKDAAHTRDARKEQLRKERQAELRTHAQVRSQSHRKVALLHTLVIMVIGLSLGVTGYLGVNAQSAAVRNTEAPFFANVARALYTFISGEGTQVAIGTPRIDVSGGIDLPTVLGTSSSAASVEAGALRDSNALIVAPVTTFTATSVDLIRESFSDPVTVTIDPQYPDTGVIVPHFRERDGAEYRFLMVPVNQSGG